MPILWASAILYLLFRKHRDAMALLKLACRPLVAMAVLCAPALANATLDCEIGVAVGTKFGPTRTYTLTVNEDEGVVVGKSGRKSNRFAIRKSTYDDSVRALELDSGDPTVRATLILGPNPRLEIVLGGGITQTDVCVER